MDRSKRIAVAEETLQILKAKAYTINILGEGDVEVDLTEVLDDSCQETEFHSATGELNIPALEDPVESLIYMTCETTLQCLHRLQDEGKSDVAVLNFASAKNPGGGFSRGSWEQEELLAAATGLVPCLSCATAKQFYDVHTKMTKPKPGTKKPRILLYTSNMIYSPGVPVFRSPDLELLDNPFTCNFISASCVNYNAGMLSKSVAKEEEEFAIIQMQLRALRVLQVAVHHGARTLVLGPWGCGINKNSAREVAKAFHGALLHPDMDGRFEEVVFAVPYEETNSVYKYFTKTFSVHAV